ncbi:MAG: hypothetical protein KAH57_06330, partial [Thermoplasmata archaeon]|nr:hypothetical protein [Thermoplasmata archaeon]
DIGLERLDLNGTIGLYCSGRSDTIEFRESVFRGLTAAFFYSSSGYIFNNCTFNGTLEDINITKGNILLYNPTYNDSRIVIDSYSSIAFYWYLDVLVNHWNGLPADNASLMVNELIGTKVFEGNSGSDGWVYGLLLLERTRFAFSNVSASPYTLTATMGNHTGTTIFYLISSTNTTVDLINMDPAAWDVLIDPLYPTTISNLTLDYTYLDPEGDLEMETMLRWYVNGMHDPAYDNLTVINSTETSKLQTWFCEVIPFDGVSYGNSVKSIPVTIQNTAPIVFDVIINNTDPLSSDDLEIDYTYFDLDGDVETRSLYRWWVDDGSGWTYSGQDSDVLSSQHTNKGETWKCIVTPGDGSSYGSPVNSTNSVLILNTPPSLDDDLISITPSEPNSVMELGVQYVYYDVDSDPEGDTRFEWLVDPEGGENYTDSGISTRVLPSNATTKGERWFCRITPHDSTEYGVTYSSPGVLILNTAPMIQGNISIFPLNPNSLANLELDYEYYDPDGDGQTSSIYRWYVDNDGEGFVFSGITHQTVLSKYLAKGQLWYCEVTPFDGEDFGPAVASLTTTIDNSPPSGSDLWISPGNAIAGEALFTEYTFEDNDGDTEYDPAIRWYRNDELVSRWNDDLSIPLNVTEKGEVWYFTIVLTDGQYSSGLYTSENITVGNRIPTITSAHITPETPSTSDGLEAVHTFFDIDGDAEVSHDIQWYRNQGDGGVHFSGLDGMDLFDSLFTSLGDMWYFRIRAYDGDDHSLWYQSDTVLIVNNLPTVTNRTPIQQALSIHELESVDFSIMAEDDDGDVVSYRWYLGDELKGEDRNFSLATDHSWAGAYTVRVDISDGLQTTSITWTVWVNDINRPPTLEIGSPKVPNPEVIEGEIVEFIVLGSDPDPEDENTLFIRWFLDGLPVGTSDTKYLYQPDYHSSGNHLITVELHDGETNSSYTWDVTVKDKSEKTGLNEGIFGLSWDVIALVIEIFLLVGSLTLAGWGAVMLKRKKGNVQKYLNLIEKIKNSSSTLEEKDRRYLLLKRSIKSDFSNGKIPENHFLILEAELESVLGKSRAKEIKDLNIAEDLKKKVYEALEDGFLSDDEIEELESEISRNPHLSSIDKQILRDKMNEWREEDADEEDLEEEDLSPPDYEDEVSEGSSDVEDDYLDDEDDGFVSGGSSNIELDDFDESGDSSNLRDGSLEDDDDDDIFEIPMNSSPDDDLDEFEEI